MNETISNTQKLGEFLRSEREKRHISIEQIASATKINIKLLHALEADNYEALPAKPFVRGFVTNYTRYLGLESKTVLNQFDPFLDDNAGKKFKRPDNMPHLFVEKDSTVDRSRSVLGITMGAFVVCGILIMVFLKPSMKKRRHRGEVLTSVSNSEIYTVPLPPTTTTQSNVQVIPKKQSAQTPVVAPSAAPTVTAPVAAQPTPVIATPAPTPVVASSQIPALVAAPPTPVVVAKPAPKPTPTPSASVSVAVVVAAVPTPAHTPVPKPSPSPSASASKQIPANEVKYILMVVAKEDSWVKYQSDDRPVSGFTLKKEQKIYIKARENIRFMTGNPKGIEFSYNRGPLQTQKNTKSMIFPESAVQQFQNKMFTD